MRRDTQLFCAFISVLLAAGAVLGWRVAAHPKLETFKLLNIFGLTYDFLGLVVLSEFVAESERWKKLVVRRVAGLLLWGQTVIPMGAAAGAWIAGDLPSAAKATSFFLLLFVYSLLPLAVLDATVFYPRSPDLQDITQRTRRFGLMLLVSGVMVQLAASFMDLYA